MNATCPQCAAILGCHDGIGDPAGIPKPDDATICAHCGQIAIYTEILDLRAPTRDELRTLLADPRIQTAVAALRSDADTIHQAVEIARRVHARRN